MVHGTLLAIKAMLCTTGVLYAVFRYQRTNKARRLIVPDTQTCFLEPHESHSMRCLCMPGKSPILTDLVVLVERQ
jgi:hypothetical protein